MTMFFVITGVFGECETEEDQVRGARENCFQLYESGAFVTFIELLNMEIEYDPSIIVMKLTDIICLLFSFF